MILGVFSSLDDSPTSLICCQLHPALLNSLMHGQGRGDSGDSGDTRGGGLQKCELALGEALLCY